MHGFIGREIKPDAITRNGKLMNFWLSPQDLDLLERLTKIKRLTLSDVLRQLIRNANR